MRWSTLLLLLAAPGHSAEICVQEAAELCCHPMCDIVGTTTPAGYGTDAPASCGTWGELVISSSSTDPFQSQGELTGPLGNLYLWATAGGGYGFRPIEPVTVSGDLFLWDFVPLHPSVEDFDSSGLPTTWSFILGCVTEPPPTLLANIVVIAPPTPVEPDTWSRIKAQWR